MNYIDLFLYQKRLGNKISLLSRPRRRPLPLVAHPPLHLWLGLWGRQPGGLRGLQPELQGGLQGGTEADMGQNHGGGDGRLLNA